MEDWQRRQRVETAFKHTEDLLQEIVGSFENNILLKVWLKRDNLFCVKIEEETKMVISVKENIEHGLKEIDQLRDQLEQEPWIRPKYAPNSLLMVRNLDFKARKFDFIA